MSTAVVYASSPQVRRGGAVGSLEEVGSIVVDLIREGRRLLINSYQVGLRSPGR